MFFTALLNWISQILTWLNNNVLSIPVAGNLTVLHFLIALIIFVSLWNLFRTARVEGPGVNQIAGSIAGSQRRSLAEKRSMDYERRTEEWRAETRHYRNEHIKHHERPLYMSRGDGYWERVR